jgi:hypothetical protein
VDLKKHAWNEEQKGKLKIIKRRNRVLEKVEHSRREQCKSNFCSDKRINK